MSAETSASNVGGVIYAARRSRVHPKLAGDRHERILPYGDLVTEAEELARRCAAAMYERDEASKHLGIEISDVGPGRARARMRVTASMVNGHDIVHGGYVFLLADNAFAFACNTYGQVTVAAAAEVVFVAPAGLGDELVADAVERTRFGRSGIYDVTVRRGGDDAVIAEFRGHSRGRAEPLLNDAP
jgi:acyl-CoA thioesterase